MKLSNVVEVERASLWASNIIESPMDFPDSAIGAYLGKNIILAVSVYLNASNVSELATRELLNHNGCYLCPGQSVGQFDLGSCSLWTFHLPYPCWMYSTFLDPLAAWKIWLHNWFSFLSICSPSTCLKSKMSHNQNIYIYIWIFTSNRLIYHSPHDLWWLF